MKVLIENNIPTAPYFVHLGQARVFEAMGYEVKWWNSQQEPAFDAFGFEPDIFMGKTFNIDRATYKNVVKRPEMKVCLYASDWGEAVDNIDTKKYPIVVTSDNEKRILEQLKKETGKPDFVYKHYHDKRIESTLGGWRSIGIKPVSLLNACDVFDYYPGSHKANFKCDVSYIGAIWGYKARNLRRYCSELLSDHMINTKIFGYSIEGWGVPQYLGYVETSDVRDIIASSKINLSAAEPHSTDLSEGFDITEKPYKILGAGGFLISDYIHSLAEDVFTNNECVFFKTPAELKELVWHFKKNPDERLSYIERGRKTVMEGHTYFSRISKLFSELNMVLEANRTMEVYQKIINGRQS
jgi:hypothetical protein